VERMIQTQEEERENPIRRSGSVSPSCPGTLPRLKHSPGNLMGTESAQEKLSRPSRKTSPLQNKKFIELPLCHRLSQNPSGSTFSEEKQSTLTLSLVTSTTLPLLRRMWDTSEEWRSLLENQILRERSRQVAIGLLPGMPPLKRPCLCSHTKLRNCDSGGTTWLPSFLPNMSMPTTNLLPSTKLSKQQWVESSQPYSPTETSPCTCTLHTSCQMGSKVGQVADSQEETRDPENVLLTSAAISMLGVAGVEPLASTNISASSVSNRDTAKTAALSRSDMVYGMHPKYLRHNLWDNEQHNKEDIIPTLHCLADWTEHTNLLPSVPEYEFSNTDAMKTIKVNPELFEIV
jgi:hypothetical protein